MSKKLTHQIHFEITSDEIQKIKTEKIDFNSPIEKQEAGLVLILFKKVYPNEQGYKIKKYITETTVKEYDVNN